jgi:hypothetical protein
MTDNIKPARLVDGEPVATEEMAKKYKESNTTKKTKNTTKKVTDSKESADDNLITAASKRAKPKTEKDVIGQTESGAIGVTSKKIEPKKVASADSKATKKKKADKVAIYSERNVSWSEVGKVYRGYNIVTQAQADKWLTRSHCRLATPEEVAKEFGKE